MRLLAAVVFDFDGLVLDTETPEFEAWEEEFASRGHVLKLEEWQKSVGTDSSVWNAPDCLESLIGPYDRDEMRRSFAARLAKRKEGLAPRPGVLNLINELRDEGIPYAIASSSNIGWISEHLKKAGITDLFPQIVSRDERFRAKPFPDLYLEACRVLDVPGSRAVALEDSVNGVLAAKAAGMWAVAAPCPVTQSMDFAAADLRVETLEGFGLSQIESLMRQRG